MQRQHERKLAEKMGVGFKGKRACVDMLRTAVAPKAKRFTALQKHMLKLAATRGVWTEDRIVECGMVSSTRGMCPLCGRPDGVHHRAWACQDPGVYAARRRVAKAWIIEDALRQPGNPMWTTGARPPGG